ncbi:SDR family oxidoreductase [Olivibacter sp. XZL3]|uniref:SDR family oxidoreductase n=1 Tax=Olivibacter sp. XZL3 TaxID=1735116 RepID=UPI001F0E4933|nr:SDR family oxidoreductase [Olivibacter sp. XZL3]
MMNISLKDKNALVCGSSDGIGLAAAQVLSGLGANCILFARNEEKLKTAVASLHKVPGQEHRYALADFNKLAEVELAIDQLVADSDIHILINNSGGPSPGPLLKASSKNFLEAFHRHLLCNQLLAQAVLPSMKKIGYGRIINIISTSVKTPLPDLGVSNTIRAAVASWAKTLANELGPFNITVNNVLPGATKTNRLLDLIKDSAQVQEKTSLQIEEEMLKSIPMKRFGTAEEVANVIAFLATPAASYISGTNIPVDGGRTPSL